MIRKRAKGQYQVRVFLRRDEQTGKKLYRFVGTFPNKEAAKKAETMARHQRDSGIAIEPTKATVSEFLDQWIAAHGGDLKPSTLKGYESIIKIWKSAVGPVGLTSLRTGHIQAALGKMRADGRKAQTLLNRYRVIHEALEHAVRWQYLAANPARGVKPPRVPGRDMKIVPPDKVSALLGLFEDEMLRLVRLALGTGLRRAELLGLRWSDFDADAGTLAVGQGLHHDPDDGFYFVTPKSKRSRRRISIGAETVTVIREQRAAQLSHWIALGRPEQFNEHDLVFTDALGQPLRPDLVTNRFRRATKETGLEGTRLHDLRHTHATLLLLGGTDARTVADRLGHARAGFTLDTYAHPVEEMDRRASDTIEAILGGKRQTGN